MKDGVQLRGGANTVKGQRKGKKEKRKRWDEG